MSVALSEVPEQGRPVDHVSARLEEMLADLALGRGVLICGSGGGRVLWFDLPQTFQLDTAQPRRHPARRRISSLD
jgi:hypothetical protein